MTKLDEFRKKVKELGDLRIATPVDDPNYGDIEKRYREASDSLSRLLEEEKGENNFTI